MTTTGKTNIASLIRQTRTAKNITQQELADLTGISLRSVQRIEHGEVVPRAYTLRTLAEKLGINNDCIEDHLQETALVPEPVMPQQSLAEPWAPVQPVSSKLNMARKIILSAGSALLMVLGTLAFIFQSPIFRKQLLKPCCCGCQSPPFTCSFYIKYGNEKDGRVRINSAEPLPWPSAFLQWVTNEEKV